MSELRVYRIGNLVISNCKYRHDIMFYGVTTKHLFWCFWWVV